MTSQQQVGHVADAAAGATIVASIMQWIPEVSAVVGLVYLLVRLYETDTVQKLVKRKK